MKIAVACDHAGFPLKAFVAGELRALGHEISDLGTNSTAAVDYPDYAEAVGRTVLEEPGLRPTLEKKSEADAGRSVYGEAAGDSLRKLRLRLGHWLDQRAPAPKDRWHDPRPAPGAPEKARSIQALTVPS